MPLSQAIWLNSQWEVFRKGTPGVVQPPPPADNFTLRTTMPDYTNTGVPPGSTLTTYDPSNTVRQLVLNTPNVTYDLVNFGNVRLTVQAANVTIKRCRFYLTDVSAPTTSATIMAVSGSVSNLVVEQCDIINADNDGNLLTALQGHHFTAYRNKILGHMDGIAPTGGGGWKIHGNLITENGWWASPVGGEYHPSDVQSHTDNIQTMYGQGEIIGNSLFAYASETVGTGTPNSGTNSGWSNSFYTQSGAEARRAELLEQSLTPVGKSWDGLQHGNGGTITPLMINRAVGPTDMALIIEDNWIGGGGVGINADATNYTNVGRIYRNKFYADMRFQSGGRPQGALIYTPTTADMPTTVPNKNTWLDNGATVLRVNG